MGRELPPAEVLAADQRITAWARQLRQAGLDGSMDELRARAYLDLLLGKDSRPRQDDPRQDDRGQQGPGQQGPGSAAHLDEHSPAGAVLAGFAGRVNLIVPLATLLDLADRPGELPGMGPINPGLARELAAAAARNPGSTWCVTVTDEQGHAIGHGCARRPASTCDFEHNVPYEKGGRTCLCNGGPKCRHDHRVKQDPRWKVDQLPDGTFIWTTPSRRTYTTKPTRYPI